MQNACMIPAFVLCLVLIGCAPTPTTTSLTGSQSEQSAIDEKTEAERVEETKKTILDGLTKDLEAVLHPTSAAPVDELTTYQNYGIDPNELLNHVLARLEYEVGEIKLSGDSATVHVTMRNVDVTQALNDAIAQATQDEATRDEFGRIYHSEEEYNSLAPSVASLLYERIDTSESIITNELHVQFSRSEGTWTMDESSLQEIVVAAYGQPLHQ